MKTQAVWTIALILHRDLQWQHLATGWWTRDNWEQERGPEEAHTGETGEQARLTQEKATGEAHTGERGDQGRLTQEREGSRLDSQRRRQQGRLTQERGAGRLPQERGAGMLRTGGWTSRE